MATTVLPEATCTRAAPAGRASWCGQLRFGDLSVPVKAYAAIATPPEIPLRQLHADCGQRIEYRKWCPQHGAVPPEAIVKGYPYQTDQYVVLSQDELDQLQPTDDKTIHLEQFLTPTLVDPTLFAGRSLYLAPGNPAARRPFALVQRALERSGKWGLGRVILSNRWCVVVVRPVQNALLLQTLHHPEQARELPAAEPSDVTPTQAELRPLVQLIERLRHPRRSTATRRPTDLGTDATSLLSGVVARRQGSHGACAAQRPKAATRHAQDGPAGETPAHPEAGR